MHKDKLQDNWLFKHHSKKTISEWLQHLRYFYFKRAWGGHANDGDEFQVAFLFSDRQALKSKIGQIGLVLNTIPNDFPRPVMRQPYQADEYNKFKSEIKQFPDLEQPGHSIILGHKTFVRVHNSVRKTLNCRIFCQNTISGLV